MATPHIVLIHGMGEHRKEDFQKTFTDPLDKASKHFDSIGKISETCKLHYISYNEIFNQLRMNADKAAIDSMASQFPGAPSLITKINDINNSADSKNFFYTHIMDVLLYRSYFADRIQVSVAKQLVKAMKEAKNAGEELHIVCHSLGTAVMHDTLHKLYTHSLRDETGVQLLSAGLNKIKSITMIANVSQLPITESTPYTSVVKPGPEGICTYFMTCRHILDPIASYTKFHVGNNWPMVPSGSFKNIKIKGVERANVHDLDHYLADPKVFLRFFIQLFDITFFPTSSEVKAAEAEHLATIVQGRFDKLKESIEDCEISLHWDSDENEFSFNPHTESLYKQLVDFYTHLKQIASTVDAT
ncbi:hypothetical protein ACROAE_20165 [Shewanella sp. MF05960]|uniref:hypothetical protein n=1 Tax=Shewanella sp. MF05960 TaxID=3434874 RepID=UPI003D79E0B6